MGCNAYAYAVVGLAIASSDLFLRKEVPTFKHDYPRTMNFCPTTGKPLWREDIIFVDGTPSYEDKFQGFSIRRSSSEYDISKPDTINYVGMELECNEDSFWSEDEIARIKKEMKEKLSPFGLWNENEFGVYPVLYESCQKRNRPMSSNLTTEEIERMTDDDGYIKCPEREVVQGERKIKSPPVTPAKSSLLKGNP